MRDQSTGGELAVQASSLGKSYGVHWALRDVSLDVQVCESVALFGANGAGKSTLLRLLATLETPSRGTLRLFGALPTDGGRAVREKIGVMMHESYLYSRLSAAENLALYAALYGLDQPEARVLEALAEVGLEAVGNKWVLELSRGMKQRLSLARATLHSPALLCLDEPDSGLDETGSRFLAQLLDKGKERGQSVVLTTHNLELGIALCQRAVILHRGRLAYSAPARAHTLEEWRALYAAIVNGTAGSADAAEKISYGSIRN